MIWWRRSEHINSWISARGNPAVNGWIKMSSAVGSYEQRDYTDNYFTNDTIIVPKCLEAILFKQCFCVRM
jgi:hypothetical protein